MDVADPAGNHYLRLESEVPAAPRGSRSLQVGRQKRVKFCPDWENWLVWAKPSHVWCQTMRVFSGRGWGWRDRGAHAMQRVCESPTHRRPEGCWRPGTRVPSSEKTSRRKGDGCRARHGRESEQDTRHRPEEKTKDREDQGGSVILCLCGWGDSVLPRRTFVP